jgi:hypothetical protein
MLKNEVEYSCEAITQLHFKSGIKKGSKDIIKRAEKFKKRVVVWHEGIKIAVYVCINADPVGGFIAADYYARAEVDTFLVNTFSKGMILDTDTAIGKLMKDTEKRLMRLGRRVERLTKIGFTVGTD